MLDKSVVKFILIGIITLTLFPFFLGTMKAYESHRQKQRIAIEESAAEIERILSASVARTVKTVPVNLEHLRCLATNIYHEAASEPYMGQVAVARVVMNRIKHGFASNPCKVIYQALQVPDPENPEKTRKVCQFSWVCEGKTEPTRNAAYRQAEEIARKVLVEDKYNDQIPSNILFFHNATVNPNWAYRKVMTIGNHTFYSKERKTQ